MKKTQKSVIQQARAEKELRRLLEGNTIETSRVRRVVEFVKAGVHNGFIPNGTKA